MNPEIRERSYTIEGETPSPIDTPSGCLFHPRCPYAKEMCRKKIPELKEYRMKDGSVRKIACHFPLGREELTDEAQMKHKSEEPAVLLPEGQIRGEMDHYHVPGFAMAVVDAEGGVCTKRRAASPAVGAGAGPRPGKAPGTARPVTADTLFAVASCTKSLTSALISILADEGTCWTMTSR